jgi:hypothetical protein
MGDEEKIKLINQMIAMSEMQMFADKAYTDSSEFD